MVRPGPVADLATGGDPLDAYAAGTTAQPGRRWPSRRLALGLSPTPRPGLVLLLVGLALGPQGLGVLSASVLTSLDPAVSAALAALGVLVGLHIQVRPHRELRLVAAASIEAGATILIVSGGVVILHALSAATEPALGLLALMLGICAAPSSTAVEDSGEPHHAVAARIGDLDDVLPIVAGVLAVAWTRSGTALSVTGLIVQGGLIALAIAAAAALLTAQTPSASEQRVFSIGALLLLGGAAAHLGLSALCVGLLAGLFWNTTRLAGRDPIARDIQSLQHPLVFLLLLVAGARLELSLALFGLVAAYMVFRIVGKMTGAWLAGRAAPDLPHDLGLSLSAPGVVAIAIALDLLQAQQGSETSVRLFAIVIAGSLGSELLSWLASRRFGWT
jgi:hypothetical protein